MTFSTETLEVIEALAGTNYTVKEIALYLGISYELLQLEYDDPDSEFRYHHDRGILKKQAERDIALSNSAAAGSITAVQIIDKRIKDRGLKQFKERLLSGT